MFQLVEAYREKKEEAIRAIYQIYQSDLSI